MEWAWLNVVVRASTEAVFSCCTLNRSRTVLRRSTSRSSPRLLELLARKHPHGSPRPRRILSPVWSCQDSSPSLPSDTPLSDSTDEPPRWTQGFGTSLDAPCTWHEALTPDVSAQSRPPEPSPLELYDRNCGQSGFRLQSRRGGRHGATHEPTICMLARRMCANNHDDISW